MILYRLALTLRFLATGETYRSLMFSTRIHESTISIIIPEVCRLLYTKLKENYIKVNITIHIPKVKYVSTDTLCLCYNGFQKVQYI